MSMDTKFVESLMRMRFQTREHSLLFNVADSPGSNLRFADAITMSCFHCRGLFLEGYEIKISRGDWLRELKSPEKSSVIKSFCDKWWAVAPEGIIKKDELPDDWGLYTATPDGLKIAQQAKILAPKPVTREFLATLMRRKTNGIDADHTFAPDLITAGGN